MKYPERMLHGVGKQFPSIVAPRDGRLLPALPRRRQTETQRRELEQLKRWGRKARLR
jgi:hypothetical protein